MSRMRMRGLARKPGPWERRVASPAAREAFNLRDAPGMRWRDHCFVNNRYSVQLSDEDTDWGLVVHLWVRRHDGSPARSWADLQAIKNDLVEDGADRVAVEVFPRTCELVDQANMTHLWVLPVGFDLPFGLHIR